MGKLPNRRLASTRYSLNSQLTHLQATHAGAMGRRHFLGRAAGLFYAALGLASPIAAGAAVFKDSRPIGIQRAAFFDIAALGSLMLAVGERGVLARSTDAGQTWTTQRLSIGRSLTSLSLTNTLCIAVGHGGLVARSLDQGASWQVLQSPDLERLNREQDAWLSVHVDSRGRIFLTGAFGKFLVSEDQGETFKRFEVFEEGFDWHLYQLLEDRFHKAWILLGESGHIGETPSSTDILAMVKTGHAPLVFPASNMPYEGSFFGGLVTPMGSRLVYGMRGRIFRQSSPLAAWQEVSVSEPYSWMASLVLKDGKVLLLGEQGRVAVSEDDGRRFTVKRLATSTLAAACQLENGDVWLAGVDGLQHAKDLHQ